MREEPLEERARRLEEGPRRDPDPPPNRARRDHGDAGLWESVERQATIAPVMGKPSVEPADNLHEVAVLAGWGRPEEDGHGDMLTGVGDMLIGKRDATESLVVSPPPEDTHQFGLDEEDGVPAASIDGDWCTHL